MVLVVGARPDVDPVRPHLDYSIVRCLPGDAEPETGSHSQTKDRPARLGDRYHGLATIEIGKKEPKYRVCAECAERSYSAQSRWGQKAGGVVSKDYEADRIEQESVAGERAACANLVRAFGCSCSWRTSYRETFRIEDPATHERRCPIAIAAEIEARGNL